MSGVRGGGPCQVCGRRVYPHECLPPMIILNSLYYCPDGRGHTPRPMCWWQRKPRCLHCGEVLTAPRFARTAEHE